MPLPRALLQDLAKSAVAGEAELDINDLRESLEALVDDDSVIDYLIWDGPAWDDDNLVTDIYLLTAQVLVNYWVRNDGTNAISYSFLDSLVVGSLVHVNDERSPFLIGLTGQDGDGGRIYGNDKKRLLQFFRNILDARLRLTGGNNANHSPR